MGKAPSPPRAPRWVKLLGLVALIVIVIAVVLLLASGGSHGPGRHASSAYAVTVLGSGHSMGFRWALGRGSSH